MGSYIEQIKNLKQNKEIIILDEKSIKEDAEMGENLKDFEFIQFFNMEENQDIHTWTSAEICSLKNNKIYFIKRIEKNPEFYTLYIDQIQRLKELNNPYIIKYYKSFDDIDSIYIIMEFMNNSDIKNFINIHETYNISIKEENIWNILLQCSLGLIYLHKQNLANLGIKLTNIFMNDEQNVKIGIFKTLDNNQNIYSDIKDDILILGNYFYPICFSEKNTYSEQLLDIIKLMTEDDINKRPDSTILYNRIRNIFIKNYAKNTSILAVLKCLYSYSDFNEIIWKKENEINQNKNQYFINYWYLKIIKIFKGMENENINEIIEDFRLDICNKYSKFGDNKEIDPLYLLIIILENIYKEEPNRINHNIEQEEQIDTNIINSIFEPEKIDKFNKEQIFYKFMQNYKKNSKPPISDLFCGIVLTEIICQKCNNINYSFSNICFINYDISDRNSDKQFNLIKDGFENDKLLYKEKNIYCEKCLTEQKQLEHDKYYKLSPHLIIYFNRGNNYENNSFISFNENLNLSDYIEDKNNSPLEYYLVGSINRIINKGKEEFIYYARDPNNKNLWYINKLNEILNLDCCPINKINSNGQIIVLFYKNKERKLICN